MKIHYSFDHLKIKNAVVTTGSFDGVHIGHKVIIDRIKAIADEINGESVLITFHPHPRRVLYPDTHGKNLKLINSQDEKKELLSKTGLDHLIIVNFTKEFAQTTSKEFVEGLLLKKLNAKCIVVGFNHHFGHNREGDYNYLHELTKRYEFKVEEIPEQDIQNETVSSTKIREAINSGKIQRANAYLDHQYIVSGEFIKETTEDISTYQAFRLNVAESTKLIPLPGIYAVSAFIAGNFYKALARITKEDSRSVFFYFLEDIPLSSFYTVLYFQKEIKIGGDLTNYQIAESFQIIDELIY